MTTRLPRFYSKRDVLYHGRFVSRPFLGVLLCLYKCERDSSCYYPSHVICFYAFAALKLYLSHFCCTVDRVVVLNALFGS